MNISKEKFTELAKEHLIALESYKIDKNGNKPIEIFGIEKLYEAINYTHCCKSDSELLPSKEKLNFEDWLKLRKIVRISDDAFKWEGSKYTYYYVNDIYKQYLKNQAIVYNGQE